MSFLLDSYLKDAITANMDGFVRQSVNDASLRHAGVALVVSAPTVGAPARITVTLRTSHLNRHSGQFALPGGRCEPGESATEAALRETHEEIGVRLTHETVMGELDDLVTRTGFVMTPVVVWAGVVEQFEPDPGEVERLIQIPLAELANAELPSIVPDRATGNPVMSAVLPSVGNRMFAPTAAVIYQFREVCLSGRHTRVAELGQPEFTTR